MKLKYEYTLNDYKKYLIRSRKINNVIIFIIGLIIYLLLAFKNVSIIFLPMFILGLLVLIYLLNIIFVHLYIKMNSMLNNNIYGTYLVELTPNKFSITINNNKTNYKYNSIKYISAKRHYFKIKFKKSREYLTFEKNKFDINDYQNMLDYFKKQIKK